MSEYGKELPATVAADRHQRACVGRRSRLRQMAAVRLVDQLAMVLRARTAGCMFRAKAPARSRSRRFAAAT